MADGSGAGQSELPSSGDDSDNSGSDEEMNEDSNEPIEEVEY